MFKLYIQQTALFLLVLQLFDNMLQPLFHRQSEIVDGLVLCPLQGHEPLGREGIVDVINGTHYASIVDGMLQAGTWSFHFCSSIWYNHNDDTEQSSKSNDQRFCVAKDSVFHRVLNHSCPAFLKMNTDAVLCM